jgi:predicted transcriptional regulator
MYLTVATTFASAAIFFNNLVDVTNENEDDRKYADTLLKHATQLYSASRTILPYLKYHKSVPTMKHAYKSSGTAKKKTCPSMSFLCI